MPSGGGALAAALVATTALAPLGTALADDAPADPPSDAWKSRPRLQPEDDGDARSSPALASRAWAEPPSAVDGEDVALALPRAVLAAPNVVLSTAFLPVRGALYALGKYRLVDRVVDFLYNDERTAAIIPIVVVNTDLGASFGVKMFHDSLGGHGESLSFTGLFGGEFQQLYKLGFETPVVAGVPLSLRARTRFEIEPHLPFYGYGAGDTTEAVPASPIAPRAANVETRYRQQRYLLELRAGWRFSHVFDVGVVGTYNVRDFGPQEGDDRDHPSIDRVYDTSKLAGFDDGYAIGEALADFEVDTRKPHGETATGVYAHAFGGGAPPQKGWRFVHYAAEIAGFIDVYHDDRVIVLRAAHEGMIGNDAEIPFAEMPRLGGPNRLRGYDLDRFRDNLTAVATVEYHYPIHEYASASLFVEMGSVGRDYRELATPEAYRFDVGGGLSFHSRESKILSLEVAYGDGVHFVLTTDPLTAFKGRPEQL